MNAELHKELTRLGVSGPEKETQFLSEKAVVGVIRWAKDQGKRGYPPTSNAIVGKMRDGGLEGYGTLSDGPKAWYRSAGGRWAWIERNLPNEDPVYIEAAIISLLSQNREPSSQSVKALAFQLEMEQEAHDESCRPVKNR